MRPALFLDRDGVINEDFGYVHRIEDIKLIPGIIDVIRYFNSKKFYVFVITNQSGIARGYYTVQEMVTLHNQLKFLFALNNANIDHFYYCPHYPNGNVKRYSIICNCRKPTTGMIQQALKDYPIDIKNSILIGDKLSDISVAQQLDIQGVYFTGGNLFDFLNDKFRL